MPILFSFGLTCNLQTAKIDLITWRKFEKASLKNHVYTFTGYHPDFNGGTSTVIEKAGGEVLGIAFEIDEEQVEKIKMNNYGYKLNQKEIHLKNNKVLAYIMEPANKEEVSKPSMIYYEGVKDSLLQHYPKVIVDRYLDRALKRTGEPKLNIQKNNSAVYKDEYGSSLRRIYPWDASLRSPFGSGIIILKPGESTDPHCHDEEETFVILEGEGVINVDGEEENVSAEDVIYFEPFSVHSLQNKSKGNLKFLAIWWGAVGVSDYSLENTHWKE